MIISYGIVPLQKRKDQWWVLLVQLTSGKHWGFPKGHPLPREQPWQTAERELKEETALTVIRRLSPAPYIESYFFTLRGRPVHKRVEYFLAEVSGDVQIQEEEILEAKWVPLSEATQMITYPASKGVSQQVEQWITSNNI